VCNDTSYLKYRQWTSPLLCTQTPPTVWCHQKFNCCVLPNCTPKYKCVMTLHTSSIDNELLHSCAHKHLLQSGVITNLTALNYPTACQSTKNVLNTTEQSAWIFCTCAFILMWQCCLLQQKSPFRRVSFCMGSDVKIIWINLGCLQKGQVSAYAVFVN
jgi:hypothetical protein